MSHRPKIKICGITREEDLRFALESGVEYIGLNRYRPSPRYVPDGKFETLSGLIPAHQRVAVLVEPESEELGALVDIGFQIFQIHFKLDSGYMEKLPAIREQLTGRELWLAPKLPADADFPDQILQYADKILLDTYSPHLEGGTGKTGDWSRFRQIKEQHPGMPFILAGGLKPENAADAIRATMADIYDFNSGVETSPGIKDSARIQKLIESI